MVKVSEPRERPVHKTHVDTARRDETVLKVADRMRQRNVGTLVVVDRENRVVGIVTDRDLVIRVLADRRDPETVTIEEVMTPNPMVVTEHGARDISLLLMKDGGFRRLPVVDDQRRLMGVLSLDDLLRSIAADMAHAVGVLEVQTPDRVATE